MKDRPSPTDCPGCHGAKPRHMIACARCWNMLPLEVRIDIATLPPRRQRAAFEAIWKTMQPVEPMAARPSAIINPQSSIANHQCS